MALAFDFPVGRLAYRAETPVLIDLDTCRLLRPDGSQGPTLQGKSFYFLEALARRPGVVVRQAAIEDILWEHDHGLVDPVDAVHKHALRVRNALASLGWPRSVIDTVDGVGWRIDMDEVERVRREAGQDG